MTPLRSAARGGTTEPKACLPGQSPGETHLPGGKHRLFLSFGTEPAAAGLGQPIPQGDKHFLHTCQVQPGVGHPELHKEGKKPLEQLLTLILMLSCIQCLSSWIKPCLHP